MKNWGPFEPLRERSFRLIWSASVVSNFGHLILGVGAAWEMTRLNSSVGMVALVQTALMLPLMLVAVPAGAMADTFDRRKVAMTGLAFAAVCGAMLTTLTAMGFATPWLLLIFCFLAGSGMALYAPAWQASVIDLVSPERLPAAVALSTVSYNLARTVGPAVGGLIVIAAGAVAAFAVSAVFYIPLFVAFLAWKREYLQPRHPPEQLHRAIVSGVRYAIHSPPIRNVVVRAFVAGLAGSSTIALAPLVARDLLKGDASIYGLLLGATGVGAILGALMLSRIKARFKVEHALRLCPAIAGLGIAGIGFSHSLLLTWVLMLVSGSAYILMIALLNVSVQLTAPRWVTARALAWFQSSLTGGIALGAWCWGQVGDEWGLAVAFLVSGIALMTSALLGFFMPLSDGSLSEIEMVQLSHEPEVALAMAARSGPVVVEIDYRVKPEQAGQFCPVMLKLQGARLRNGGFNWSLARDIAEPSLWTERFHYPTWGDYIRQRSRFTQADHDLQRQADAYHDGSSGNRVRRRLEGPFSPAASLAERPDSSDVISVLAP